jgi:hypothetical protein
MTNTEERIFIDAYRNVQKSEEYIKYFCKAIELGYKIKDYLGQNSSLFLEYESCFNLAEVLYLEETYKMGLKDGLDLF